MTGSDLFDQSGKNSSLHDQPPQELIDEYADAHAQEREFTSFSYLPAQETNALLRCAQRYGESGKMSQLILDGRVITLNPLGEVVHQEWAGTIEETLQKYFSEKLIEAEKNGSARLEHMVLTVTKQDHTESER